MSHKAKGLSKNQPLTVFPSLGWILPSPEPIAALVCAGPGSSLQDFGASRPEGCRFPLLPPVQCRYPSAGSPLYPASTRCRDSTAMCSPFRVTQYQPTWNITANTSPHCQATGFTSSSYVKFHFKKGKTINNQWNSNVGHSTVWTERGH